MSKSSNFYTAEEINEFTKIHEESYVEYFSIYPLSYDSRMYKRRIDALKGEWLSGTMALLDFLSVYSNQGEIQKMVFEDSIEDMPLYIGRYLDNDIRNIILKWRLKIGK